MQTKDELIAECKLQNPTMIQIVNDVKIELTGADYDQACADWAEMRLVQLANDAEQQTQVDAKAALLERLGITAEEAALLLA